MATTDQPPYVALIQQAIEAGATFADLLQAYATHKGTTRREEAIIKRARAMAREGENEVDDVTICSGSSHPDGDYVLAWLWVDYESEADDEDDDEREPTPPADDGSDTRRFSCNWEPGSGYATIERTAYGFPAAQAGYGYDEDTMREILALEVGESAEVADPHGGTWNHTVTRTK